MYANFRHIMWFCHISCRVKPKIFVLLTSESDKAFFYRMKNLNEINVINFTNNDKSRSFKLTSIKKNRHEKSTDLECKLQLIMN